MKLPTKDGSFYVYILKCYRKGKYLYYTGQTNNLKRRRSQHIKNVITKNRKHYSGQFKYADLIWFQKVSTRQEAKQFEQYIKKLSQVAKRRYMRSIGVSV